MNVYDYVLIYGSMKLFRITEIKLGAESFKLFLLSAQH